MYFYMIEGVTREFGPQYTVPTIEEQGRADQVYSRQFMGLRKLINIKPPGELSFSYMDYAAMLDFNHGSITIQTPLQDYMSTIHTYTASRTEPPFVRRTDKIILPPQPQPPLRERLHERLLAIREIVGTLAFADSGRSVPQIAKRQTFFDNAVYVDEVEKLFVWLNRGLGLEEPSNQVQPPDEK